ncbi:NAD(P)/FAD-dependent oxidoreductase [Mangrovicella endophytica]|uniref:NAD(P)/FAD-dependent oxidoreductase n=1 Tax=Mangrovicella endophytica TaxID=2066697 RepID=UPI000C9DD3FC|nr:NAD(P)/FAD-dependent oxidoreductase [Mangrovicella endophytica]
MRFDSIVIGAGPAGSTLAAELARAGRSVALIERSAFPRRKVCGEFISAASLPVIESLGLGEVWQERAGPEIRRLALFAGDRIVEARMPDGGVGYGRALGRDVLDQLILDCARQAGAQLFQPYRATGIVFEDGLHSVAIASRDDDVILRAPVVIAAHGSWETGPLLTQAPKARGDADLFGFKAHFRGATLAPEVMPLLAFPGGYGGIVWADDGRLSLSCCIRRSDLAALRAQDGGAPAAVVLHRHLMRACRGIAEVIGDARLEGKWLAAGPIRPGIRRGHCDDVFRVGNVAGESHPIIAEGISMAIQSAWLLARELNRIDIGSGDERAAAGRRYEAAWKAQFSLRIRAAELFARLALRREGRAIGSRIIGAMPQLLTAGAALAGKTKVLAGAASPAE